MLIESVRFAGWRSGWRWIAKWSVSAESTREVFWLGCRWWTSTTSACTTSSSSRGRKSPIIGRSSVEWLLLTSKTVTFAQILKLFMKFFSILWIHSDGYWEFALCRYRVQILILSIRLILLSYFLVFASGEDFSVVQKDVAQLIKKRILVGHALEHDMKVLFLSHPRTMIRDTSKWAGVFLDFCVTDSSAEYELADEE